MRKLFVIVLALFALLGSAALAQDTPVVYCGDLAAADCAVLEQMMAASATLDSAAFDFELSLSIANIPEIGPGSLDFRLTGTGAYAVDRDGLDMDALMDMTNPENLGDMPRLIEDMLQAISADATLILFFPDTLTKLAADSGTELPEKVSLSLRLVDGFGYINLDKLAELDTEGTLPRGWMGLDVAGFMRRVLDESVDTMDTSTFGLSSITNNQELVAQYSTLTRQPDTTIDGQPAAVFQTDVDLGAFYQSPEFRQLMEDQMQASGVSGMNQAEMDRAVDMIIGMYDGMTARVTQIIGLDDYYVHQTEFTFNWPMDMNALMGMGGGIGRSAEPVDITITFRSTSSRFNDAPAITAPDDATIVPLNALLRGSGF